MVVADRRQSLVQMRSCLERELTRGCALAGQRGLERILYRRGCPSRELAEGVENNNCGESCRSGIGKIPRYV